MDERHEVTGERRGSAAGAPSRLERRVCALLDLENLLHGQAAPALLLRRVSALIDGFGTPVYRAGCGNRWLVRGLAPTAVELGIRLFGGSLGRDRADRELLARLRSEVPASCDTLVIGSGDGAFEELATHHRRLDRRVVVVGRPGAISARLRAAADDCVAVGTASEGGWASYRLGRPGPTLVPAAGATITTAVAGHRRPRATQRGSR